MRTWTALLLAFALIACGTAAVVAAAGDGADGADTTVEYTKVFNTDGPETVSIDTHESELDGDPTVESYQVQWKYSDGVAWQDLVLGQDYTVGDWKFNLVKGTDGIYDVTLSTDEIASKTEIRLNCSLSITYTPDVGGGTVTETADIILKVSKNGALPAAINNYFEFIVDTAISKSDGEIRPEDSSQAPIANDFNWFASDLPDGVSMTADGHLSGIPKRANSEAALYKVYAENPLGSIAAYNIYIRVFERDESPPDFWVHSGDMAGFDPETGYPNPKVSAVQHGDAVHLIVSKKDAPSLESLKVSVVDHTVPGYRKYIDYQDGDEYRAYSIPTGITGAYGVIIEFGLNTTRTLIYVLPQLEVVVAGIGVSSSSTATDP